VLRMAYDLPLSLPPIECLVAAVVAARTGSFTQAANELGVSHAAVSRRVSGAESWAGTALFVRHGRGVRVTDDGQRLLARVAYAFDIVDQAASQWRKPQRAKMLRIATTHSLARLWLIPRIAVIEAAIPEIRIELITGHQNVNLANDEADIAIRCGKGGWRVGREIRLFPEERMHPVATPEFIATHNVEPGTILSHPLIHGVESSGWQTWAQAQGLNFKGKFSDRICSDYTLALAAAEAHLGIALLNSAILPAAMTQTALKVLDVPASISPLSYFVIVPPQKEIPLIQSCVDQLLSLAGQSIAVG
jgi:LysR family transcriptional regulator, glycine cleavage system transcriptional activator